MSQFIQSASASTITLPPSYEQTYTVCLDAVRRDGLVLSQVSLIHKTPELCLAAVQQNGLALRWVTRQTTDICMAAICQNGMALEHANHRSRELCLAAIQQNGDALKFAPLLYRMEFSTMARKPRCNLGSTKNILREYYGGM